KRANIYHAIQAVRTLVTQSSGSGTTDTSNTIATAVNVGNLDGTAVYSASGSIGTDGQVPVGAKDIDLLKVTLTSPGVITANLDPASIVRLSGFFYFPLLRLFNSTGTQLDTNLDSAHNQLAYTFLQNASQPVGVYYIGVSSSGNAAYNISNG